MSDSTYEARLRASFDSTLAEASEFFMGRGDVRKTLRKLSSLLAGEGISYAILGAMALGEHGYVRMTDDVDVLVTARGLEDFVDRFVGRGYVAAYPGATRAFRDTETGVRADFVISGEYPGDGKPKAVAFPDPVESVVEEIDGVRLLALDRLVEVKLASGMSSPDRLRDLADVQELIRLLGLDDSFAERLDPSVRGRFLELRSTTIPR